MNADASNQADRCLSDAAKQAERKRVEEQTYDKLDVIACERTRMIAEALINQLTNEEDGNGSDNNAERINKLRDSSKLFEPIRDQRITPSKPQRPVSGEPAKKLLRELLEQANAQLRAEEAKPANKETTAPACATSGCEPKLTTKQIQTIVLQSASTKQDLEAQKANQAAKEPRSCETKTESETEKPKTETPSPSGKNARASRTNMPGARKQGAQSAGSKNILSLISQSEALVNDAVRKAHGTLKKIGAE